MRKHFHFVGIAGIGMSALAKILLQRGERVSGLDQKKSPVADELESLGAEIKYGDFSGINLPQDAQVVLSSAIGQKHPEYCYLKEKGFTFLHRAQLLQQLAANTPSLFISGTHGKTSISSLLAFTLHSLTQDTSFAVGGIVKNLQSNGLGTGKRYFVAEADESDRSFLYYQPHLVALSNLEQEHMENYADEADLFACFQAFACKVSDPDKVFWCKDCPNLSQLELKGRSYGFSDDADFQLKSFEQKDKHLQFDLHYRGKTFTGIRLQQLGKHQALNAALVFAICLSLGFSEKSIKEAFSLYQGVGRRADICLENSWLTIIDDYAHHPSEIACTLQGIRQVYPEKRLIAVFQPHRYSRFRKLEDDFAKSFSSADEVLVCDLYSAGEPSYDEFSLDKFIKKLHVKSACPASYLDVDQFVEILEKKLRPHDLVVCLGAGTISAYAQKAAEFFQDKVKRLKLGLVFGGKTPEHEVSITSAKSLFPHLNPELYEVSLFGVSKSGNWSLLNAIPETEVLDNASEVLDAKTLQALMDCEVFFPLIHGQNGEDGTLQGFFETLGKPYVGCDVRAASICMDKALSKRLVQAKGFRVSPYIDFSKHQFRQDRSSILRRIENQLQFPVFLKPVHLGSSVGIYQCFSIQELEDAIEKVLFQDYHFLVEEKIIGREIEFAVLGNDAPTCPPPGEILANGRIYDYQAKYEEGGFDTSCAANLPEKWIEKGRQIALEIYQLLGCKGLSRVDFFFNETQGFIFNEVNPLPGCTPISLYPKIQVHNGIPYPKLLEKLIAFGLQRKENESDSLANGISPIAKTQELLEV